MAHSRNLFALLDTEEEDAFSIVAITSPATVKKPGKVQENNKHEKMKSPVYNNPMMTKSNRNVLPDHVSRRPVTTKEKLERERTVGDYRKKTENRHSVVNGNGNYNNGSFQGNFKGSNPHNNPQNPRNSYGGYQGNSRRNLDYNDAEGWQIYHGRNRKVDSADDNHSQNGEGFNGYGGDRRWRRSDRGNRVYSAREEDNSDDCEKAVENGEIVEAGKDSEEFSNVNEGEKDSSESKKDGGEAQKKRDDDEKVAKKKEDVIQFTLEEYEKMQLEKRKALESEKQAEQRKVVLDKDFESMLLVQKKRDEEELAVKQNSGVVAKKKDNIKGDHEIVKLNAPSYRHEFLRRRNERLKRYEEKNVEEPKKTSKNVEEAKKHNKNGEEAKQHNKNGDETKKLNNHVNGSNAAADLAQIVTDANQFPALGGASFLVTESLRKARAIHSQSGRASKQ
ncbi:hypothetical protein M5689_019011 [Euphorbia peplus]|nr:hypothetical protein M5689_019011 [Euphorbia peplus]